MKRMKVQVYTRSDACRAAETCGKVFITTTTVNSIGAEEFSEILLGPLQAKGKTDFGDGYGTSPPVTFAPHPNHPPRRGEGTDRLS